MDPRYQYSTHGHCHFDGSQTAENQRLACRLLAFGLANPGYKTRYAGYKLARHYRPGLQNGSVETSKMGRSIFVVSPSAGGKWNVAEEGFAAPIAYFDDKGDAIDYATDLAKTKHSARIDIRNGMGSVEAMLQFEDGHSTEAA